jgi:hypothetical protein
MPSDIAIGSRVRLADPLGRSCIAGKGIVTRIVRASDGTRIVFVDLSATVSAQVLPDWITPLPTAGNVVPFPRRAPGLAWPPGMFTDAEESASCP